MRVVARLAACLSFTLSGAIKANVTFTNQLAPTVEAVLREGFDSVGRNIQGVREFYGATPVRLVAHDGPS